ncbi:hypothetical protein SAMN05421780_105208 [Flexibacter flexilis DSM 6793]|uniref:Uncharacterized protein n=1 Tax=Flexibacter flexilis DSM 6793 TaxID=927664 RepID=A0A1I1JCB3_9BACT|nr:hypothetical protein SAMN05421780_105208 [Flexibacter flexilis DSM 6793]
MPRPQALEIADIAFTHKDYNPNGFNFQDNITKALKVFFLKKIKFISIKQARRKIF